MDILKSDMNGNCAYWGSCELCEYGMSLWDDALNASIKYDVRDWATTSAGRGCCTPTGSAILLAESTPGG